MEGDAEEAVTGATDATTGGPPETGREGAKRCKVGNLKDERNRANSEENKTAHHTSKNTEMRRMKFPIILRDELSAASATGGGSGKSR